MNDFNKQIPIPVREVVRSGTESARLEAGAGSRRAMPSRIERLTGAADKDHAPKIERAIDRGINE